MKDEEVIEMKVSDVALRQVENRIQKAHVRGLDTQKAAELGIFKRMSLLLCGMHSLNAAAFKVWGHVENMLELLGADKKHEIRVACNSFQYAFDSYMAFWSRYYSHNGDAIQEMNGEVENLYHQFMRWAQLPESWGLGEPQFIESDTEPVLQIEIGNNKLLKFHRSEVESETIGEPEESYVVTRFDEKEFKQILVERGLDKSSAQMVAKRLSVEDKDSIYTVSSVLEYTKRVKDVTPVKSFKAGNKVGDIKKVLK